MSSGPQPSSIFPPQPAPVMLPPLHYQGMDAAQPFGYQPPPAGVSPGMGMHPSRLAALGAAGPMMIPQAGMVRTADEMQAGGADELPPPKRQKVAKLPGGQLYPEADWINMHPVRDIGVLRSSLLIGSFVCTAISTPFLCRFSCQTNHPSLSGGWTARL